MPELNKILDRILVREGGWSDHSADRGGQTKHGVTLKTLQGLFPWADAEDLKDLSREDAKQIYRQLYWEQPGFDSLQVGEKAAELLLDTAVHSGGPNAVKMLQRAVCIADDGIIGPLTRTAVGRVSEEVLVALMITERMEFIGNLISKDHTQAVFAKGWLRRLSDFVLMVPKV